MSEEKGKTKEVSIESVLERQTNLIKSLQDKVASTTTNKDFNSYYTSSTTFNSPNIAEIKESANKTHTALNQLTSLVETQLNISRDSADMTIDAKIQEARKQSLEQTAHVESLLIASRKQIEASRAARLASSLPPLIAAHKTLEKENTKETSPIHTSSPSPKRNSSALSDSQKNSLHTSSRPDLGNTAKLIDFYSEDTNTAVNSGLGSKINSPEIALINQYRVEINRLKSQVEQLSTSLASAHSKSRPEMDRERKIFESNIQDLERQRDSLLSQLQAEKVRTMRLEEVEKEKADLLRTLDREREIGSKQKGSKDKLIAELQAELSFVRESFSKERESWSVERGSWERASATNEREIHARDERIHYLEQTCTTLEAQLSESRREVASNETALMTAKHEVSTLEDRLMQGIEMTNQSIAASMSETAKANDMLSEALKREGERWEAVLKEQRLHWSSLVDEKDSKISALTEEAAQLQRSLNDQKEAQRVFQSSHEAIVRTLESDLLSSRAQAESASQSIAHETKVFESERAELERDIDALQAAHDAELEAKEQDIHSLTDALNRLQTEVQELNQERDEEIARREQLHSADLIQAKHNLEELAKEKAEVLNRLSEELKKSHSLRLDLAKAQSDFSEIERAIERLKSDHESELEKVKTAAKLRIDKKIRAMEEESASSARTKEKALREAQKKADDEIDRIRADSMKEIDRLKMSHAEALEVLKAQHRTELLSITSQKQAEVNTTLHDHHLEVQKALHAKDAQLAEKDHQYSILEQGMKAKLETVSKEAEQSISSISYKWEKKFTAEKMAHDSEKSKLRSALAQNSRDSATALSKLIKENNELTAELTRLSNLTKELESKDKVSDINIGHLERLISSLRSKNEALEKGLQRAGTSQEEFSRKLADFQAHYTTNVSELKRELHEKSLEHVKFQTELESEVSRLEATLNAREVLQHSHHHHHGESELTAHKFNDNTDHNPPNNNNNASSVTWWSPPAVNVPPTSSSLATEPSNYDTEALDLELLSKLNQDILEDIADAKRRAGEIDTPTPSKQTSSVVVADGVQSPASHEAGMLAAIEDEIKALRSIAANQAPNERQELSRQVEGLVSQAKLLDSQMVEEKEDKAETSFSSSNVSQVQKDAALIAAILSNSKLSGAEGLTSEGAVITQKKDEEENEMVTLMKEEIEREKSALAKLVKEAKNEVDAFIEEKKISSPIRSYSSTTPQLPTPASNSSSLLSDKTIDVSKESIDIQGYIDSISSTLPSSLQSLSTSTKGNKKGKKSNNSTKKPKPSRIRSAGSTGSKSGSSKSVSISMTASPSAPAFVSSSLTSPTTKGQPSSLSSSTTTSISAAASSSSSLRRGMLRKNISKSLERTRRIRSTASLPKSTSAIPTSPSKLRTHRLSTLASASAPSFSQQPNHESAFSSTRSNNSSNSIKPILSYSTRKPASKTWK